MLSGFAVGLVLAIWIFFVNPAMIVMKLKSGTSQTTLDSPLFFAISNPDAFAPRKSIQGKKKQRSRPTAHMATSMDTFTLTVWVSGVEIACFGSDGGSGSWDMERL